MSTSNRAGACSVRMRSSVVGDNCWFACRRLQYRGLIAVDVGAVLSAAAAASKNAGRWHSVTSTAVRASRILVASFSAGTNSSSSVRRKHYHHDIIVAVVVIKSPSTSATMSMQQATNLPVASTLLLVWTGLNSFLPRVPTLALNRERQSARKSKTKNGRLAGLASNPWIIIM